RANTKALEDHAAVNKRDRAEMLETIRLLEEAQILALENKRREAEERIDDEIRHMRIQAMEDVNAREVPEIQFAMEKRIEAIQREFGFTSRTWDLIVKVAQAADEQMLRHSVDSTRKAAEEGEKAFLEAYKHEGDAALKMAQDNLKEQLKSYEIE